MEYIRFLWFLWLKVLLVIGYNTINIPGIFEVFSDFHCNFSAENWDPYSTDHQQVSMELLEYNWIELKNVLVLNIWLKTGLWE